MVGNSPSTVTPDMTTENHSGTTDREQFRITSVEEADPATVRAMEGKLPLTASVANLLPESLIRCYTDDEEYPEGGKVWEFWPDFECKACNRSSTLGSVCYEFKPSVGDGIDKDNLGIQFAWDGIRPACQHCGSGLSDRMIERYRPARWKQPLLHSMGVVRGCPNTHEPLLEAYDHDPVGFVKATAEELQEVDGIGRAFSRGLVIKKHGLYSDVAPEPNAEWDKTQEHKARRKRFGLSG